jgi:hypothetical protein
VLVGKTALLSGTGSLKLTIKASKALAQKLANRSK